jgi:hypothetical protein
MRFRLLILLTPIWLAACGTTEKTVVVNPPANSTVVVSPNGDTQVIKHDGN